MKIVNWTIDSPVGPLELFEKDQQIIGIQFKESDLGTEFRKKLTRSARLAPGPSPVILETKNQLIQYFDGKRRSFSLPIHLSGTPFQKKAWQELLNIPYGTTVSYSEQAEKLGGKTYSRAVGQANHNNPIVIIVPCHRVVGKNGSLTGFGGGLSTKAWLIQHEAD